MPETRNWRFALDFEGIGWLTIDTPDAPVNMLSRQALAELETLVMRFEDLIATGELIGVVLLSGKESGFIAGADVNEFDSMTDHAVATTALERAHALFNRIETLKALLEVDPDCTAVMLSSLATRQTVEQALTLGAAGYLRKDLSKDEIGAALVRILTEKYAEPDGSGEPSSAT